MNILNILADILIPRFLTVRAAVVLVDTDDYSVVCETEFLTEQDQFDRIFELRIFNLFGFGLFPSFTKDVTDQYKFEHGVLVKTTNPT